MKKLQLCMTAAILGMFGVICCAYAQDSTTTTTTTTQQTTASGDVLPADAFYRADELSIDAFGSGSIGQQTINHISGNRIQKNGRAGAEGVGVNYFFTRYIGISGDAYSENTAHNFVDSASGNLIGRIPIGNTGVAPYVFGGGGHQFDEIEQNFAQAGGGIEFRFAENVGFFVDARYVFADKTQNYGVGRAGIRLNF